MLTLTELQKKFTDALNAKNNDIHYYICDDAKLSADAHLHIYQNSIFGIKQKALQEIYPVCQKLVGTEFFIAMINEYIPKNISQTPDLANYGMNFSEFISDYVPAKCLAYLADVARLEWAWHRLFTALDTKGIDFQAIAERYADSPEQIIFLLSSGGTLISSPYPIHHIWEFNQDDFEGDQAILLPENKTFYFFVWRNGLQMRVDLLDIHEWHILNWIKEKITLDVLCTKFCDKFSDVNFEKILLNIVRRGWLGGFNVAC